MKERERERERERVQRRRNERLAYPCISKTDRYGGCASLIVWCGISGWHCTDLSVIMGNLNGVQYRGKILQQHVEPFILNHPEVEMFQHDNARPHTTGICTAFLADAGIDVMDWNAMCPDFIALENMLAILSDKIKKRDNPPRTMDELNVALWEEWQAIAQRTIRIIFNSMRRRCVKCVQSRHEHVYRPLSF